MGWVRDMFKDRDGAQRMLHSQSRSPRSNWPYSATRLPRTFLTVLRS